jgi:hypothetical protein
VQLLETIRRGSVLIGVPLLLRWVVVSLACLIGLRAAPPMALLEAIRKSSEDEYRWAYTETTREIDDKGRSDGDTVVRFDPSKPYAEQFTPLLIKGKAPTARQLKAYRKRGEERGKGLERERGGDPGAGTDDLSLFDLNGESGVIDFERATVTSEAGSSATYLIPLRKEGKGGPPLEKFQLTMRVNRDRQELEHVRLKIVSPVRLMLVAKIDRYEFTADYAVVDAKFPPTWKTITEVAAGSLMFVKGSARTERTRTEFQHVKAYHERFGVKIGPLKALPF